MTNLRAQADIQLLCVWPVLHVCSAAVLLLQCGRVYCLPKMLSAPLFLFMTGGSTTPKQLWKWSTHCCNSSKESQNELLILELFRFNNTARKQSGAISGTGIPNVPESCSASSNRITVSLPWILVWMCTQIMHHTQMDALLSGWGEAVTTVWALTPLPLSSLQGCVRPLMAVINRLKHWHTKRCLDSNGEGNTW